MTRAALTYITCGVCITLGMTCMSAALSASRIPANLVLATLSDNSVVRSIFTPTEPVILIRFVPYGQIICLNLWQFINSILALFTAIGSISCYTFESPKRILISASTKIPWSKRENSAWSQVYKPTLFFE